MLKGLTSSSSLGRVQARLTLLSFKRQWMLLFLVLAQALTVSAQPPDSLGRIRFKYDFIVPTNGNFVDAIHACLLYTSPSPRDS